MQARTDLDASATARTPLLTVVITTHDRPDAVRRALASVQDQTDPGDVQIVVVDDGSRPDVAVELDELAGGQVVVLHQEDLGLGTARRTGASVASGRWLTFLDDDDRWLPNWSDSVVPRLVEDVAVVSGGARFADPDGQHLGDELPRPLGPLFSGLSAQYLAGCFAVRADVYAAAGGYLPGLSCSHQTELFIRIGHVCRELGLVTDSIDAAIVEIERRPARSRSLSNPRLLLDGARWMLARHAESFAADPGLRADTQAVVAVNAARSGRFDLARRAAWASVRSRPTDPRGIARLALTSVRPVARKVWRGGDEFIPPSPPLRDPLVHVAALRERSKGPDRDEPDLLFLPWRYRQNRQASIDDAGPYWTGGRGDGDGRAQAPVYRLAGRLARRRDASTVVDVGCGTGDKLVRYVAPHVDDVIGLDQGSGLARAMERFPSHRWLEVDLGSDAGWSSVVGSAADMVICADVIEHVDDPYLLLRRLHGLVGVRGTVVLSTPDRSRLERGGASGPPHNPRHVREWSGDELELLVEAAGFSVMRRRRLLPRRYSPTRTDLNLTAYRALHGRAVPDRRTCLVLEMRARPVRDV